MKPAEHCAGERVVYVGDRVRRPGQLNGKSSNLNHIILNKIYPDVTHSSQVSWKDILMVMDCDHLVERAYFHKCCATLLDKDVAVRRRRRVSLHAHTCAARV
jgi:hypothetical protein